MEATSTSSWPAVLWMRSLTARLVPTGTVDLHTTTQRCLTVWAMVSAASKTKLRSAKPSPRLDGVPTAMKIASAPVDRLAEIACKGQAVRRLVARHQFRQARLVDRHHPLGQAVELALVLVDDDHLMAEVGKAGAAHKSDISGADHRDFHQGGPCSV